MKDTARRALVAALVVVLVVAVAIALWRVRIVISLLFLAFIIAAAMRPSVEALHRRRIPRGIGIGLHYFVLAAGIGVLLWQVVPRVIDQVDEAIGDLPQERSEATGIKHEILSGIEQRLDDLPSGEEVFDPAVEITITAFEIGLGIFFTLAAAAYWIFERDRFESLVLSLLPYKRRRIVRDTWNLIDRKLGAYVRGQLLLIVLVATVLSLIFWLIGLPFWILIGIFAGIVEIIPVIGPIMAGALAIGVGLTVSWQVALAAGVAVTVVRLLEDYIVIPRVLGHAVGLTPLTVLVAVTVIGLLFGAFGVLLAIPFAAIVVTLLDVVIRGHEPTEEEVPTVIFPAKEGETTGAPR